jgi:hypothetical protein
LNSSDLNLNRDSLYAAHNVNPEYLKEMFLEYLRMSVLDGGNFDPFSRARAAISAPGLDEVTIANINDIPDGLTYLDFDVSAEVDLVPYFRDHDAFTIRLFGNLDGDITNPLTIEMNSRYKLHIKGK